MAADYTIVSNFIVLFSKILSTTIAVLDRTPPNQCLMCIRSLDHQWIARKCTVLFVVHLFVCSGSRDGAVVRALASHQCGPGSIPGLGVICGSSLLLVLVLAPRGFSPGTPAFLPPQKPTFLNSNLTWKQWS